MNKKEFDKDDFDKRFDEAIREAASNAALTPDATPSWKKVERRIRQQQRRKQRLKLIPYIAVSFFLGALFFGSPMVSATFSPFFQSLQSLQDQMTSLIFGVDRTVDTVAPKTPPPPDMAPSSNMESSNSGNIQLKDTFATWQEAAPYTTFNNLNIGHQVSDFAPMEVRLFFDDYADYASRAMIAYEDEQGHRYRISMRVLGSKETITSAVTNEGSRVEQLKIHDREAILVMMDDGRTSLEYIYMNMFISISGQLSKEQIISVANGIELT